MKHIFFSLSIFIYSLALGQDYAWPINTGKQLTSNFGEFRDDHFHSGLDIRTNQTTGHPLFAVRDGYIYRITTSFGGGGNALYLKTDNNRFVYYGHLSAYSDLLEKRLFSLQDNNRSYLVNKYFSQDEYPVKRGEIIGFSGDSGGSTGPHLHFELRNDMDQPLNPLVFGFPVADNISPIFLDLTIIPLSPGANVNNTPLPKNSIPQNPAPNVYILKDTLSVDGKFGITTRVIDKIQNVSFVYQIKKLELSVDSLTVFYVNYDLLDYSESTKISTIYGQPVSHYKHDEFQKLYRLEKYPKLTIHGDNQTGILDLTAGIHKLNISAIDAAQNRSNLTFYINANDSSEKPKYTVLNDKTDYPDYQIDSKYFVPKLIQLEKGTVFQLQTELNKSDTIQAYIENSYNTIIFPLRKIESGKYVSDLLNPIVFKECISCGFLIATDKIQKYEFDFIPQLVLPNSNYTIFTGDQLCSAELSNTSYDTTLFWISKHSAPKNNNSVIIKNAIYDLNPYGIPFKNNVQVHLAIHNANNLDQYAIYAYNPKKLKWVYKRSTVDKMNNYIIAELDKHGAFTALKDVQPPWFLSTYPQDNQIYNGDSLKQLVFTIDDDLSGINDSENQLQVSLDGKRIWVAYQPYLKEISYYLRNPLPIGEHDLIINIADRSSNSLSKTIKFFIE